MKNALLFITLISSVFAGPMEDYNTAVEKLKEQHKKAYMNGGDLKKLDAILETETKKLKEKLDAATADPNIIVREVEIDAETTGKRIGSFLEGEEITLEYVKGDWVAYGGWKIESPDTANVPQHRIVLVHRAIDGKDTIITYPRDTKGNPLKIKIEVKGNYFLKIADPALDSNKGKVTYKVGVVKPQ